MGKDPRQAELSRATLELSVNSPNKSVVPKNVRSQKCGSIRYLGPTKLLVYQKCWSKMHWSKIIVVNNSFSSKIILLSQKTWCKFFLAQNNYGSNNWIWLMFTLYPVDVRMEHTVSCEYDSKVEEERGVLPGM